MYHIGFDRILVFVSIYLSGNRPTSEKKCGRILKVKLIFNRKSPGLPMCTHQYTVLTSFLKEYFCLFVCFVWQVHVRTTNVQIQEKWKGFHPIVAWEADIGQWAAHPLLPFLWRLFISTNFPLWAQFFQILSHN